MGSTITNDINPRDVSIAIEQLLIAPEGTVWDGARIDIAAPPTGFKSLGAVDEEASVVSITREKLELRTGIPRVLQFNAVTGLEGKISSVLLSNSNRKAVFAMGAADIINVSPNAIISVVSTTANPLTASVITFSAAPTGNGIPVVGDEIVASTLLTNWEVSTNIATVASLDGTNPTTVFHMFPPFETVPLATEFAARPVSTRLALGTSVLKKYHLIGVADWLDGSQLVHTFPKVSAFGEWVEEVRPSQTGRIPISFDAFGTVSTKFNGGASELVVGERYMFQPVNP